MVRHKNRYLLVQVQYTSPAAIETASSGDESCEDEAKEPVRKKAKDIVMGYPESSKVLYDAISKAVEKEFGVFGRGAVKRSLAVKYWNSETGSGVVRCARQWHETVIAAVGTIKSFLCVNEDRKSTFTDAALRVLHVSGTIRLCADAAVKLGKAYIASVEIPEDEEDKEDE